MHLLTFRSLFPTPSVLAQKDGSLSSHGGGDGDGGGGGGGDGGGTLQLATTHSSHGTPSTIYTLQHSAQTLQPLDGWHSFFGEGAGGGAGLGGLGGGPGERVHHVPNAGVHVSRRQLAGSQVVLPWQQAPSTPGGGHTPQAAGHAPPSLPREGCATAAAADGTATMLEALASAIAIARPANSRAKGRRAPARLSAGAMWVMVGAPRRLRGKCVTRGRSARSSPSS